MRRIALCCLLVITCNGSYAAAADDPESIAALIDHAFQETTRRLESKDDLAGALKNYEVAAEHLQQVKNPKADWLKRDLDRRLARTKRLLQPEQQALRQDYADFRAAEERFREERNNYSRLRDARPVKAELDAIERAAERLRKVEPMAVAWHRFRAAQFLRDTRAFDEAVVAATQARDQMEAILGRPHVHFAWTCELIGSIQNDRGELDAADESFKAASAELDACLLRRSSYYEDIIRRRALLAQKEQRYADARTLFFQAAYLASQLVVEKREGEQLIFMQMMECNRKVLSAAEADFYAQKALDLIQADKPPNINLLCVIARRRAALRWESGEPAEAEAILTRAIKDLDGQSQPLTYAMLLCELGRIYTYYEAYPEARIVTERALAQTGIAEDVQLVVRADLAEIYAELGDEARLKKIVRYLTETDHVIKPGFNQLIIADAELRFALRRRDFTAAVERGRAAVKSLLDQPGVTTTADSAVPLRLAIALAETGKHAEAEELVAQALAAVKTPEQEKLPVTWYKKKVQAHVLRKAGKNDAAQSIEDELAAFQRDKCRFTFELAK